PRAQGADPPALRRRRGRTDRGREPERQPREHRGRRERARQRDGSDAAPGARGRAGRRRRGWRGAARIAPGSLPGPAMSRVAEPRVDLALAREHGLSDEEYAQIERILGRTPSYSELGIFSVMWSEHCSYKSSKKYLKRLPTSGPQVLQGPGENAGVVSIGDGLAVVFK